MGVEEFQAVLRRYQVVGLDAMTFIYHFEDNPAFAPLTEALFEAIEVGNLLAHVSILLVGEVLTGARKAGDEETLMHYRHVFSVFPNLRLHDVDMTVVEKMADLRAKYGLRTPDAIHMATALLHGAQAFVTNDNSLKRVTELDVLVLSDYAEKG